MAAKDDSRRKGLVLQAADPTGGNPLEVQISFERMQAVAKRSLGHAKECGYIVPFILQNPNAVFEGLRRDEDEDPWGVGWRCYCGVPDHSYRRDGSRAPPYHDQVYLVFINDEGVASTGAGRKQTQTITVFHRTTRHDSKRGFYDRDFKRRICQAHGVAGPAGRAV